MTVLKTILTVLFIIDCAAMIVVILMQEGKSNGLGALAGMNQNNETYWGKNKSRSMEGNLIKITRWLSIAFFVIALILNSQRFS